MPGVAIEECFFNVVGLQQVRRQERSFTLSNGQLHVDGGEMLFFGILTEALSMLQMFAVSRTLTSIIVPFVSQFTGRIAIFWQSQQEKLVFLRQTTRVAITR